MQEIFQRQFFRSKFLCKQEETGGLDRPLRAGFFECERARMEDPREHEKRIDGHIEELVFSIGEFISIVRAGREAQRG
jgi:hypothetical protein